MSLLFTPLRLKNLILKNRIAISPMCEYSSADGFANDWHLVHLGSRAVGGAGLVITEATAVSPEGRITHQDLGIWKQDHIDYLSRITSFIKKQGSSAGMQLAHAGRKASHHVPWEGGKALSIDENPWQTFAPSPIPYNPGEPIPKALTTVEIKRIVNDFSMASARAVNAGFDLIEIHAAHGYLINEFLSPLSNQRNDEYGGNFMNRIRFLLEIVQAIRNTCADGFPLLVRISASDWLDGGWSIEDSVSLCSHLKNAGVDLVDCSSGGNVPKAPVVVGPLYQVPFAERIKKETGLLTGAVGMITKSDEAENILQKEQADLILFARQSLRDPYLPLHAAKELDDDIKWPVQYERAKK